MNKECNCRLDKSYYKNRILYFILNNSGEFGAEEIAEIFGCSKRTVQYFIEEYNKMGFEIKSSKGRYYVIRCPANFKVIKSAVENEEMKELSLYARLKEFCKEKGYINKNFFMHEYLSEHNAVTESGAYLNKLIGILKRKGYLNIVNSNIYITTDISQKLSDDEMLRLLIYVSIIKNTYPKGSLLHDIFYKLLMQYEKRGLKFEKETIVYAHKNKISFFDEALLYQIEKAICESKNVRFKYKIRNGEELFEISPSGIVYSSFKDIWYLIEEPPRKMVFRFDRILNLQIIDKKSEEHEFDKDFYDISLGMSSEIPVDVEVEFDKEYFILRKLKNYMSMRKDAIILEEKNKYILKDKVCGVNEFLRWVRTFGDSAVCIKPQELRNKMKDELKLMQKRYEGI